MFCLRTLLPVCVAAAVAAVLPNYNRDVFLQRHGGDTFSATHLCAIWIHAVGYLHIQMMYFATPWKSPVAEKISLLLANTHFISLPRALYLIAEFIHFLSVLLPTFDAAPSHSMKRQHSAIIFAIRISWNLLFCLLLLCLPRASLVLLPCFTPISYFCLIRPGGAVKIPLY